jgi:mediator of RNA polymerase II transcription subunit 11
MGTNSMPIERLQALDNVEKEIASCIQSAGQALMELSKDKPSMKQVEGHTSQFLKTLSHVEAELSKHINYLTQVSTGNNVYFHSEKIHFKGLLQFRTTT